MDFYKENYKNVHYLMRQNELNKLDDICLKYNLEKLYFDRDGHNLFKRSKTLFLIFRG